MVRAALNGLAGAAQFDALRHALAAAQRGVIDAAQ